MKPFSGIRVCDLTHVLAGPFATYQLAVMGGDVIKVENPDAPDMMRSEGTDATLLAEKRGEQFMSQNANKRSLAIDLHTPEGKDILWRLIATCDVLVENFRGGVLDALGFGYAAVSARKPDLIYCSITGFGRTGPKAGHPAYDNVIQAYSGLMAATGTPTEHPVRVGPAVLDYGTGAQAAFAIAAALFQREKTGQGQYIDVAMADAALMLMSNSVTAFAPPKRAPDPVGNFNPQRPGYSAHETADGLLMTGAFTAKQMLSLCRAVGMDDAAGAMEGADIRRAESVLSAHRARLSAVFKTKTCREWEDILQAAGVPVHRVQRLDHMLNGEQINTRSVLQSTPEHPDLKIPVSAFSYAHDGPGIEHSAPTPGQHNAELLAELFET